LTGCTAAPGPAQQRGSGGEVTERIIRHPPQKKEQETPANNGSSIDDSLQAVEKELRDLHMILTPRGKQYYGE
jgi:hypothetical protein